MIRPHPACPLADAVHAAYAAGSDGDARCRTCKAIGAAVVDAVGDMTAALEVMERHHQDQKRLAEQRAVEITKALDALRAAGVAVSTDAVAGIILLAKDADAAHASIERILAAYQRFAGLGEVPEVTVAQAAALDALHAAIADAVS